MTGRDLGEDGARGGRSTLGRDVSGAENEQRGVEKHVESCWKPFRTGNQAQNKAGGVHIICKASALYNVYRVYFGRESGGKSAGAG